LTLEGSFRVHIAEALLLLVTQNFDEVLVPADHVSRSPNDTYYIDTDTVLRCHTSAHQAETLRKGLRAFLITGAAPNS
jgi:phenylalanyl-tRNA synthetase alpha chain